MVFELIPAAQRIEVEGQSETEIGSLRGVVIAIGLRGGDPVAHSATEQAGSDEPEVLLGWGTTYFLVADPGRPAPVWVAKNDVTKHRVVDGEVAFGAAPHPHEDGA